MTTSLLLLLLLVSAASDQTATGAGAEVFAAAAPTFPACQLSTTCGSQNISYPFWLYSGTHPSSFCGYPSFAIDCRNNSLFFHLLAADNNLAIARINYTLRTISLHDPGAADPCPQFLTHSLLTTTPTDPVLTFFLNCSRPPLNRATGGRIPCPDGGSRGSYLYAGDYNATGWPCSRIMKVSASNQVADYIKKTKAPDLEKVMKLGFELQWREDTSGVCGDCERSGGLCGYQEMRNVSGGGGMVFGCYCGVAGGWRGYVCGKLVVSILPVALFLTAGVRR
ncbi:putative serine/threonine-protein kinase [Apostasia shenzhenica]|uniref:Putative serine/threonine-protein kinase n=1 Tax=Apostasia shenzhenica TaxID=1088818 RepID=A0A2I0AVX7_9ASPA|nr:putative serine/threonine-protein kinase [Apostasia shenzhenica]